MARVILVVWTIGFLIGTTTHLVDLVSLGWMPQAQAPVWMNLYWTSLALLDPLTVVLLWTRRRWGVWLGIAVMVTDVAINSYATYGLGVFEFGAFLQLQSLFGGFVLGSAAILLRGQGSAGRP